MSPELLLAAGIGAGLANTVFHLRYHQAPLYLDPRALPGEVRGQGLRAHVWAVVGVVVVATVGFGLGGGALPAVVALLAIYQLRRWEIATWPGDVVVRLGKYAPASACLLGWVVAWSVGAALGLDPELRRAHGWDAAAGVFGGCYVLAAIAKLRESGLQWGRAEHMSLMLAERGFGRLGGLRLWLAQQRLACQAVGVVGLGMELAGVALVWGPARPAVAVAVVLFKLFTWVLFGYFEPEWVLAILAIGLAAS